MPVSPRSPTWGSRTAPVTIVEFGDLECPFCARADETLAELRASYGPDTLRIVWKNFPLPFHRDARPAAEAAMGVFELAGDGAFWKFHDAAMHAAGPFGPAVYEQWAAEAGVKDLAAFRAGLADHRWAAAVAADESDAQALGVFGTPTFFVNGVPLTGALPFITFQGLVDGQVRLAQAKIAAGTPRERLYVELTHENRAKLADDRDDRGEADAGAAAQAGDDEDADADTKTVYRVPLGASPARGSPSALVTVVEFADYQCPYCIRAEPTLKALREQYGDKVRFVFKDLPLPFHPRAEPAAEAALEVRAEKGDAAFWAMHDALLAEPADLSDDTLVQLATRVGARGAAVRAAIAGHAHQASIERDRDLADDLEANGTPSFFVNGRRVVGAQPKETFEAIIDDEVRHAQAVLASGTRPEALYDTLVRDGKVPAAPPQKALPPALPARDPGRGGSAAARVTVHEWSDFECPFCKQAEPTIARLLHDYGSKVRLVWHDLPLPIHADAPLAARAAREALAQRGEPAFWRMHDEIFAHQDQLGRGPLDGYARALGLDMTRWGKALDAGAHQQEVDADRDAAAGLDIDGTPAFVIVPAGAKAGYYVAGAEDYETFRRLVDRALDEAK